MFPTRRTRCLAYQWVRSSTARTTSPRACSAGSRRCPCRATAGCCKRNSTWEDSSGQLVELAGLGPGDAPEGGAAILSLAIVAEDADGHLTTYDEIGFGRDHPRAITRVLARDPSRRSDQLEHLF